MATEVGSTRAEKQHRSKQERRRRPGILVIIQNLPLVLDRRVRMECGALLAAGYHVSVICPRGDGEDKQFDLDGVRVYTYRPPPAASGLLSYVLEFVYCWLRTALLSLRVLRREGFSVIQACNPPDTYWLLGLLYKVVGKKFVYDQHDICPEVYEAKFGRQGLIYRLVVLLERATHLVADHVISTNDSYREIAMGRGRRRSGDVTVVMSAPDPWQMRPTDPDISLKAGKTYLCCYLGIMGAQDGVDHLLHAIDYYVHVLGRDDCHFALLGYGDSLAELRVLSSDLGIDPWVTFTGRVKPDEITHWLSSADLGLTPDPMCAFNDRSTMNKTLEYMAHGLPVVAFDLTETRRSAGAAGLFVTEDSDKAFGDAIADLLDDPDRRATMGRFGRQRIETVLSWQRQSPGYVAVFDQLLGRRLRRPLERPPAELGILIDLRPSLDRNAALDQRPSIDLPAQRGDSPVRLAGDRG